MPRRRTGLAALIVTVLPCLAGCLGGTHSVVLDEKTARLEFGVVAVQLEAGGGEIVDFCVVLNDSICGFPGGEVLGCGLDLPADSVHVFCADPILAQWPDAWTLLTATWSAPSVPASGNVLVEAAAAYLLPPGTGIVTDPGHSAWVVRLDLDSDFGPADVDFEFVFDHGTDTDVVLKAVEVATAELRSFPDAKILVPLGEQVIDFPNLPPDNVLDLGATAVRSLSWGRVKSRFRP